MTAQKLSEEYRSSAALLVPRIRELRRRMRHTRDPEEAYCLWRRIVALELIRRQALDVAVQLERYCKGDGVCTEKS